MAPLSWSNPPSAGDFWPDKLRIEVGGTVQWGQQASFQSYLRAVAPSIYFTAKPTMGRQFRADIRYGPAVTGDLRIQMTSPGRADEILAGSARITLALNLNPTIARALSIRRNEGPLDGANMARFFKPRASVAEAYGESEFADASEVALDRAANVLLSMTELGGTTPAERAVARNTYLALFERNVRALAQAMLKPDHSSTTSNEPEAEIFCVAMDWDQLLLRQAELYVERRHDAPVALVQRLYDRALDLARRVKGQKFWDVPSDRRPVPTMFSVSQDDGYPHLIVPLTGTRNVELSVYAKTNRRVRFEVR